MSHYLEANDSVRSAWALPEERRHDAYLQAWTETLFALAFGRDVVVPATYAVDSFACQRVLADVSSAYDEVVRLNPGAWYRRPRPVRLHLHASATFGEHAAAIVTRVLTPREDTEVPPFHSSLYPDLRERISNEDRLLDQLRAGSESCDLVDAYGDDERGELFRTVWRWCRGAAPGAALRVVPSHPASRVSLQSYVDGLLRTSEDQLLGGLTTPEADAARRTLRGLRVLQDRARTAEPFSQRSRLRQDWPWSAGGQSAAEIVGQNVVELVREVVDTLYNRVVARSIGDVTASFCTTVAAGTRVGELFVAQGLAVSARDGSADSRAGVGAASHTTSPSAFELRIDAGDAAARQAATAGLDRSAAVSTLVTVLAAQTTPSWAASTEAMTSALRSGDLHQMSDAVGHHCELLSELLGDRWRHDTGHPGGLRVRLGRLSHIRSAATAGGAAVASNAVSLVASANPAWLLAMAGLSAAGGVVAAGALQRHAVSRHRSAFRGAMSEIVAVRESGR